MKGLKYLISFSISFNNICACCVKIHQLLSAFKGKFFCRLKLIGIFVLSKRYIFASFVQTSHFFSYVRPSVKMGSKSLKIKSILFYLPKTLLSIFGHPAIPSGDMVKTSLLFNIFFTSMTLKMRSSSLKLQQLFSIPNDISLHLWLKSDYPFKK